MCLVLLSVSLDRCLPVNLRVYGCVLLNQARVEVTSPFCLVRVVA